MQYLLLVSVGYVLSVLGFRVATHEAYFTNDSAMIKYAIACVALLTISYLTSAVPGLQWALVVISCLLDVHVYYHMIRGPEHCQVPMDGKIAVITGANTGCGLETARVRLDTI